ncbi:unnamed protein product [Closterium sp. NIES-65]|nr:unnamed protein product [Closterium sp. NIES-65]
MKRALQESNEAIQGLNALVQQSLDLQREVQATLRALQASELPNAPVAPNNGNGDGAPGGSGSGSNDLAEETHESELKRAVAAIMEPAKHSVYQKCITEGDGTGDKGLSMWPDHNVVVHWSAATGAIWESQKEKLLYCLNHSAEHSNTWSAVAARMRGGIVRVGKTVLFRFLGIPRHVADLPKEFSARTHFKVLIAFPPPKEAWALPTEIVGPEMSEGDDEIPAAPTGHAEA